VQALYAPGETPVSVDLAAEIARARSLAAWAWALLVAVALVGYALGTLLALHVGYSFLLLVGAVCVYAAAGLLPSAPRPTVVAGPTAAPPGTLVR